jgi:uncharacterized membrane protein YkvA (DUF1232 family)
MTKGSFFANVLDYFGDSRIPRKEKMWITIGTILYVISPLDLLPGLPFDDIGVLGVVLAYMNWRMKKNTDTSTKIDKVDILPGEIIKEPEDFQKNFFSDKK